MKMAVILMVMIIKMMVTMRIQVRICYDNDDDVNKDKDDYS